MTKKTVRKAKQRPTAAHVTYPREAVLTLQQVAQALQVSRRQVQGLDLPFVTIGRRQRFLWGQILDLLAERAEGLKAVA